MTLVPTLDTTDEELTRMFMLALEEMESDALPDYWQPQPGPQTAAYESEADIIGYGGGAGGGKSDLLLGLAAMKHHRSIIFRRVFPSVRGLIERSREIFNPERFSHSKDTFNESLHIWRLGGERLIEFGAVQYEQDRKKHQGQPRDFFGFDEATEFPESVVRFLIGWNRTTVPGQKCQTVLTFNPPMDESGEWVIRFFAPWLDPTHPNPARDGELRYFAMLDGEEQEVESGEPFDYKGRTVVPKSRTFFHALLKDNPILESTGYGATIDALPEPERSFLLGNFDAARIENPYQVIPTAWLRAAVERGKGQPLPVGEQTAIGVDIARGGRDKTVIAPRYGHVLAPLLKYPGVLTPDGQSVVQLIVNAMVGTPLVNMDVIGIGSSAYDYGKEFFRAEGVNFSEGTSHTDRSGRMRFANVRAAAYWRLRELLDPESSDVVLPDDKELVADLAAARWEPRPGGKIYIESKEDIIDRLSRSPDCGDAAVLSFWGTEPLPSGMAQKANPSGPSRFNRNAASLTGSRWRR
jgi:hypothetical protein